MPIVFPEGRFLSHPHIDDVARLDVALNIAAGVLGIGVGAGPGFGLGHGVDLFDFEGFFVDVVEDNKNRCCCGYGFDRSWGTFISASLNERSYVHDELGVADVIGELFL